MENMSLGLQIIKASKLKMLAPGDLVPPRCKKVLDVCSELDGFVLIYKRLSVKGGYQWPRNGSEVRNLTWREFDWLMSGIDIDQPKALRLE
jgi:hypothetical protein